MPLPFLKIKPPGAVTTTIRKPDGAQDQEQPEDESGINAAAADLIRAIHSKDENAVAAAIRAAFEILDSEPHEEGEHTNEPTEEGQE